MRVYRDKSGLTETEFLAQYDENKYRRPSVTVDMAVFTPVDSGDGLRLGALIIQRGGHPFIGRWALPGGFVRMDEELDAAAERELMEETGVCAVQMRQFGAFAKVDRDPRTRIISVGYYALLPYGTVRPRAGDDAGDADLFSLSVEIKCAHAGRRLYSIALDGKVRLNEYGMLVNDGLGWLPAPAKEGCLSSDHGFILFSALYAVGRLERGLAAARLAGERRELIPHMRWSLDNAVGVLSV